ncbi:helix-turn-helix domain-containing protein [Bailinhaonella thermotolerans]|uniref:XRE family transcriptional regulator n=1 Tax=Bailinhaonella thermotolerans TaxID=1070861 RepID=A0A3A4AU04_9ACTN|nr:helix-turn-helix transcriptional regulator [Bailinhaonella thermotolerans]RJL30794.1 XRE family transcriptional regulator [Bailinhaonella thermotolerans]
MPGTETIGERLRAVRKQVGFTQRELARASGVSLSLIRLLEQGRQEDTRLVTVRKLAVALKVPTTTLILADAPEPTPETIDLWAPVRRALREPKRQPDEAVTVQSVAAAVEAVMPLFRSARYRELAAILPGLLRDAEALPEGAEERHVRLRLLQLTGWLLTQTQQFDAAEHTLRRALDIAGDRFDAAATVNTLSWLMLRSGRLTETRRLAVRWADDIEPRLSRATLTELAVWGSLLLRVSNNASRDNQMGEARDAMRLAQAAAVRVGREYAAREDAVRTFGPTTVALKRTENAMIEDLPDKVLALARAVPTQGLRPTTANLNRHRLDLAFAHAKLRHYPQALEALQAIRREAPEWLVQQRYATDIVRHIVDRRRTLTDEMRDIAAFVGVQN